MSYYSITRGSIFVLGLSLDHSFLLFSITHSIMSGIGLGLTFIVPISLATKVIIEFELFFFQITNVTF